MAYTRKRRASKRMLRGLPPTLLLRAEHEILWDEVSQMGQNLANAGQEVRPSQFTHARLFRNNISAALAIATTPTRRLHTTVKEQSSVIFLLVCPQAGDNVPIVFVSSLARDFRCP